MCGFVPRIAPRSNGLIAFQSNVDHVGPGPNFGQAEIYVMNLDGSGKTRLTTAGGADPAWSPDGSKIAFSTNRDGNAEIYVMNADGSAQARLTNRPSATDIFPVWSPEGDKIAFASFNCCPSGANYDIWVMNADGSNQVNITNHPAEDIFPSWSPDGTRIAFQTNRDGNREIYVVNVDGSGGTNFTNAIRSRSPSKVARGEPQHVLDRVRRLGMDRPSGRVLPLLGGQPEHLRPERLDGFDGEARGHASTGTTRLGGVARTWNDSAQRLRIAACGRFPSGSQ